MDRSVFNVVRKGHTSRFGGCSWSRLWSLQTERELDPIRTQSKSGRSWEDAWNLAEGLFFELRYERTNSGKKTRKMNLIRSHGVGKECTYEEGGGVPEFVELPSEFVSIVHY